MWQLKFEYTHSDCLYTRKLLQLGLTMYGFPLIHYQSQKEFRFTGLQLLSGSPQNIGEYMSYIRNHPKIGHTSKIGSSALLFQMRIKSNIEYYRTLYDPRLIYLSPIEHSLGREVIHVASWDRALLEKILHNIKRNPHTRRFKLHYFTQKPLTSIFLPQISPKMTARQRYLMTLAKSKGYYEYPRGISLQELAKILNISTPAVHESLRRAERKVMDFFI